MGIEISFDKIIILRPHTRMYVYSERLAADYLKVFSKTPDKISDDADLIQRGEDVEDEGFDDDNKYQYCSELGYKPYDVAVVNRGFQLSGSNGTARRSGVNYKAYYLRWYMFYNKVYQKKIGANNLTALSIDEIIALGYKHRGAYRYFCIHRPPDDGCIPDGSFSYETYAAGSRYIGEATYNWQLTSDDLYKYGLVFDDKYTAERTKFLLTAYAAGII